MGARHRRKSRIIWKKRCNFRIFGCWPLEIEQLFVLKQPH